MAENKAGRPALEDRTIPKTISIRRSIWEKFEERHVLEKFDTNRRLEDLIRHDNEDTEDPRELRRRADENNAMMEKLTNENLEIMEKLKALRERTDMDSELRKKASYQEKLKLVIEALNESPELRAYIPERAKRLSQEEGVSVDVVQEDIKAGLD